MNLQERMQQVATIKENIQRKISQNYLMQFIDEPYIDEDRIMILIQSLNEMNLPVASIERFVTTAMLIQIALDTHDKVNNTNESLKKQQLTVLAGDYYSGLYYKLLAEVENVPLIRSLANGIKLVNEYKIILYRMEDNNLKDYIHTLKKTESTIVTKFIHFFGMSALSDLCEELLLLNKLIREKEKAIEGKASFFFEALKKFTFPTSQGSFHQLSNDNKNVLIQTCQKYIEQTKESILNVKEQVKLNELMDQRVNLLLKTGS